MPDSAWNDPVKLRAAMRRLQAASEGATFDFDGNTRRADEYVRACRRIEGILSQAAKAERAAPAQIDESKLPPRPAGHNGADTDPDSPLVRYGRAESGSGLLLEPMDDGYWTPWHIANEMLRAAQAAAAVSVGPTGGGDAP